MYLLNSNVKEHELCHLQAGYDTLPDAVRLHMFTRAQSAHRPQEILSAASELLFIDLADQSFSK